MSLFDSLLKPASITLYLDLGSFVTRLGVNDQPISSQPTSLTLHRASQSVIALGNQQGDFSPDSRVQLVRPVMRGAVEDVAAAGAFLKSLFEEHLDTGQKLSFARVKGYCLYPSQATKVEKSLLKKALKASGYGRWQLVSKTQAYLALLKHDSTYQGSGGVIDIGHNTTECLLWDSQSARAESKTLFFGGHKFSKAVIETVKVENNLTISHNSAQDILEQFSQIDTDTTEDEDIRLTVRGKNLSSGKPDTVIVSLASFREPFIDMTKDFIQQLQIFFSQIDSTILTSSLDRGLVLTGGGSRLSLLHEFMETYAQLQIVKAKRPKEDSIRGLKIYVKEIN